MTTPAQYTPGSIKQDAATLAIAVRSSIAAAQQQDWNVMTVDRGGRFTAYDEVSGWPDIYIAP